MIMILLGEAFKVECNGYLISYEMENNLALMGTGTRESFFYFSYPRNARLINTCKNESNSS